MKKTIVSALVAMAFIPVFAQKEVIEDVVDLGQVQFYEPATATFSFANKSNEALAIDHVDTGCGCTKANFSNHKVLPGKNFEIKVTYDARTMGHFDKIIEVYTKSNEKPIQLELCGQVVADKSGGTTNSGKSKKKSKKKSENKALPEKIGELYADCNYVQFDNVPMGKVVTQQFHIYNPTNESVQPQFLHLPSYITATITPAKVKSNHTAEVTLTFDSSVDITTDDIGLLQSVIYLAKNPGERVSKDKQLTVAAVITPSTDNANAEYDANAPHIGLSDHVIKAQISRGKKKNQTITVINTGKTDLDIKRVQVFTQGLEVSLDNSIIAPGESARLKVKVNSKVLKNAKGTPRILLVTNDPENQTVFIDIRDED